MALLMISWDLPTNQEQMEIYKVRAQQWTKLILEGPGIQEWRGFRNPLHTSPQAMVTQEYDTLASCQNWLQSADYAGLIAEMRSIGCTNFSVQVWDASPLLPKPLRPSKAGN